MNRLTSYLPAATLTGTLAGLGLAGVAIAPGSIALVALGSTMIAAGTSRK